MTSCGHWGAVAGPVPDDPTGDRPTSLTDPETVVTIGGDKEDPLMPRCSVCKQQYERKQEYQETCGKTKCRVALWRKNSANKPRCAWCEHMRSMHTKDGPCRVRGCDCKRFDKQPKKKEKVAS